MKHPEYVGPVLTVVSGLVYCGLCWLKGNLR